MTNSFAYVYIYIIVLHIKLSWLLNSSETELTFFSHRSAGRANGIIQSIDPSLSEPKLQEWWMFSETHGTHGQAAGALLTLKK